MQNSRFIRSIIVEQKEFSQGLSEIIRKLYTIEYSNDNNIDLNDIGIRFPAPMSLNLTNIVDQVNNIGNLVDPLMDLMINVSENDKDIASKLMKDQLYRKYITMLDWDDFDNLQENILAEAKKRAIQRKVDESVPTNDSVVPTDTDTDSPSDSNDSNTDDDSLSF